MQWYISAIEKFLDNPFDEAGNVGDDVMFECSPPDGVPEPEITWLFHEYDGKNKTEVVYDKRKIVSAVFLK